jgi:hypothetical protein
MIDAVLLQSPRYRVLAKIPLTTSLGTGQYVVWVRADAPDSSGAASTSVAE